MIYSIANVEVPRPTNVSSCIVCQQGLKDNLVDPRPGMLSKLLSTVEERAKYKYTKYDDLRRRVEGTNEERLQQDARYHLDCYKNLTNIINISRLKRKHDRLV